MKCCCLCTTVFFIPMFVFAVVFTVQINNRKKKKKYPLLGWLHRNTQFAVARVFHYTFTQRVSNRNYIIQCDLIEPKTKMKMNDRRMI